MPRPKWSGRLDMSNLSLKQRFMRWIGTLQEEYDVSIEPKRTVRTNQQLGWWWPCVINPYFEFMKDQEWDVNDPQDAHDMLRERFLRVPTKLHPVSGEALGWRTRHTRELTPAEFSEFAEKARAWLASELGIITLDPNEVM